MCAQTKTDLLIALLFKVAQEQLLRPLILSSPDLHQLPLPQRASLPLELSKKTRNASNLRDGINLRVLNVMSVLILAGHLRGGMTTQERLNGACKEMKAKGVM